MRIRGYMNHGYRPPAPFIVATMHLRELDLEARMPFLIDTGASGTIMLWRDLGRLGIDISSLRSGEREFTGLGGLTRARSTSAVICFTTEGRTLVREAAEVFIVSSPCPSPKLKFLPSILGRDVLNEYNFNYSPGVDEVYLEK